MLRGAYSAFSRAGNDNNNKFLGGQHMSSTATDTEQTTPLTLARNDFSLNLQRRLFSNFHNRLNLLATHSDQFDRQRLSGFRSRSLGHTRFKLHVFNFDHLEATNDSLKYPNRWVGVFQICSTLPSANWITSRNGKFSSNFPPLPLSAFVVNGDAGGRCHVRTYSVRTNAASERSKRRA